MPDVVDAARDAETPSACSAVDSSAVVDVSTAAADVLAEAAASLVVDSVDDDGDTSEPSRWAETTDASASVDSAVSIEISAAELPRPSDGGLADGQAAAAAGTASVWKLSWQMRSTS